MLLVCNKHGAVVYTVLLTRTWA